MPAPRRSPPRNLYQRLLIGFGIMALALSGVLLWEPLVGASATTEACGYVGCVTATPVPPTATTPPPPPPPPTATKTPTPKPTKTPTHVPPSATPTNTAVPPPPPPPTATPTEQPCVCPSPTPTNTAVPPPPPPPTYTPTEQPCVCPTPTNTPVPPPPPPPTATPTTVPPPPPPPTPTAVPDEGCTPGFWKQPQHFEAWGAIAQNTTLETVFDVPNALNLDNATLLEALGFNGGAGVEGGARILLRAAVAAYLNASHPEIEYPLTAAQVVAQVNTALASNNRETMLTLAATLDRYNNLGCPDAPTLDL